MNLLMLFLMGLFLHRPVAVSENVATCRFERSEHNFGRIALNQPATAEFVFTNTGTAPLVITQVAPSCGCTASGYTKTPVAPGQKGFVKLTYNTAHAGAFNKTATVTTNGSQPTLLLTVRGEVAAE